MTILNKTIFRKLRLLDDYTTQYPKRCSICVSGDVTHKRILSLIITYYKIK